MIAGYDFEIDLTTEIEKCLALRKSVFSCSKTKCLDEVQKIAVFVFAFAVEQRAITGEQRAIVCEKDREDDHHKSHKTPASPGMKLNTANPFL